MFALESDYLCDLFTWKITSCHPAVFEYPPLLRCEVEDLILTDRYCHADNPVMPSEA